MNAASVAESAKPLAPRQAATASSNPWFTGALVAFAWGVFAGRYKGELYEWPAVAASSLLLGIAAAALHWKPPAAFEGLRAVAVLLCAESFQTSGMPILNPPRRDDLMFNATPEAFTSNVVATALFACSFLAAVAVGLSVVKKPLLQAAPGDEVPRDISISISVLFIAVALINVAYGGGVKSPLAALGVLPLIILNEAMIVPLGAAAAVNGSRASRLLLALYLTTTAGIAAWSTMLGSFLIPVRAVLLTMIILRRRGVAIIVALGGLFFFVVNPAKALVREDVAKYGPAQTFGETADRWQRAILTTWTGQADVDKNVDKSARRLDYNSAGAAVFAAVPVYAPYKGGQTYIEIPAMLIPRIIMPSKGDTKDFRSKLTIEIGIQAADSAETASIALPAPAEAYWNFGWAGVVVVPALLGLVAAALYRLAPPERFAAAGFIVFATTSIATFQDMLFTIIPQIFFVLIGRALFVYVTRPRPDLIKKSAGETAPQNT